jgi:hypothetical protein
MSYFKVVEERELARDWLKFLLERQPHKLMELKHRYSQLNSSGKARRAALARCEELAMQYPQDYLVFQTQRRLLGK